MNLSKEEVQIVLNLCDLATKAQGLTAAEVVLPLARRCVEALKDEAATTVSE